MPSLIKIMDGVIDHGKIEGKEEKTKTAPHDTLRAAIFLCGVNSKVTVRYDSPLEQEEV